MSQAGSDKQKIGFAGLSHLGIVSSICWASMGWSVVVVDGDADKVSLLEKGRLPIHEPRLPELLAENRSRLEFASDFSRLAECDVVCISLDTDTDESNRSDLSGLELLVESVIPWLAPGALVVLMSQVPVGFTRRLLKSIRSRQPEVGVRLYYWVETLVIGDAVERCLRPQRIILGRDGEPEGIDVRFEALLSAFGCPVLKLSYESAELTKSAINLYLAVSVTYANVLADLCEARGASMGEIVPALRMDRRIGQYAYIRPSLGIAGGNLERDLVHLRSLGDEARADTRLIGLALDYNANRYYWVHRQLDRHVFKRVDRPTISVWGLAYKKDTQSTKNSFATRVLGDLAHRADLRAYDPVARLPESSRNGVTQCDRLEAVDGADCLLVLTDWEEFADTDYSVIAQRMPGRVIIDCVGVMDRAAASENGFRYVSIGEPLE